MASKIKGILVFILAMFLLFGCDPTTGEGSANGEGQGTQTPDDGGDKNPPTPEPEPEEDTTPPESVVNLQAAADWEKITVSWTNPAAEDLDYVQMRYFAETNPGLSIGDFKSYEAPGAFCSYEIPNLTNGVKYTFEVFAVDTSGNRSQSVSVEQTPHDITPPGQVRNVTVTKTYDEVPGTSFNIAVTWTNPNDEDIRYFKLIGQYIHTDGSSHTGETRNATDPGETYTYNTTGWYGAQFFYTITLIDADGNESKPVSVGPYVWEKESP